jgi:hypothetical protein
MAPTGILCPLFSEDGHKRREGKNEQLESHDGLDEAVGENPGDPFSTRAW